MGKYVAKKLNIVELVLATIIIFIMNIVLATAAWFVTERLF
jgi:hypothetical protein